MTDVQASADPTEISVNDITQIVASVLPANATDKKITYSSDTPSVATVDEETGVVTGISAGKAIITARSANGKTASVEITVTYVPVTKITIDPSPVVIGVTGTADLKANIIPKNASAKLVTWSSDNDAVATVDPNSGKVTGVSEGKATITAKVDDSGVVGQCVVTVGKENGVTMELTNPYSYEVNGKTIDSTVLCGEDMDIVVHVNRDGQPANNTNVTLKMSEVKNNNNHWCYEIKGDHNTTNASGDVHFVIGVTQDCIRAGHASATKGIPEIYSLIATDVATGQKAEIKVNTAKLEIGEITVSGNTKAGKNWEAGRSAKIKTESLDGHATQTYLASQEVSLSGKSNNSVIFSVDPKILYGSKAKEIRDDFKKEYTDENDWASGIYSIYNDETNTTTSTGIENIPAGLRYLTVNFSKIDLSRYSQIRIDLKQNGTSVMNNGPVLINNESNTGNNSNVKSIQLDLDRANVEKSSILEISVITQGRKSVNETGYVLESLVGKYSTNQKVEENKEPLSNVVTWEDVSNEVTYQQMAGLPDGYKALIDANGKDFKYRVPVFPYTGDAFITYTTSTNETATCAYPISNHNNKNDLYDVTTGYKAMKVTNEEATQVVTGSDLEMIKTGNSVSVNATKTGMTALKATIDIKGIDENIFNDQTGRVLYTSVQWSPVTVTDGQTESVNPEYYAIEGQTVTVIAQLTDRNGNKATVADVPITFTRDTNTSIPSYDRIPSNEGTIYVQSDIAKTDSNGQSKLVLLGDGNTVLKNLRANPPANTDYNVELKIESTACQDIINNGADFYWVDLGLSYNEESMNDPTDTHVGKEWDNKIGSVAPEGKSTITETWEIGYRPMVKAANGKKINVVNIPVKYTVSSDSVNYWDGSKEKTLTVSSGNASQYLTQKNNGQIDYAEVTSNMMVDMHLTGKIDVDKVSTANNILFKVENVKNGKKEVVDCPNIGSGVSRRIDNTGLKYTIKWGGNGTDQATLTVDKQVKSSVSVNVNVRLNDKFGNLYDCDELSCQYVLPQGGSRIPANRTDSPQKNGFATFTIPAGSASKEGYCQIDIMKNGNIIASDTIYYTYDPISTSTPDEDQNNPNPEVEDVTP